LIRIIEWTNCRPQRILSQRLRANVPTTAVWVTIKKDSHDYEFT
jgi:hypothetical protein